MRLRTMALTSGALLTATLLLAGCAQNDTGGGMPGMDHGTTPMTTPSASIGDFNSADEMFVTGMMSDADMTALESATGADATRLFLEGMIGHHQGAVQMAQPVIDNGQNPAVADLAQTIIDGQTTEIVTMQDILGTL